MHSTGATHSRKLCQVAVLLALAMFISFPAQGDADLPDSEEQLLPAEELHEVVERVLAQGKTTDMGDGSVVKYLEFRDGGLRRYVTVEGVMASGDYFGVINVSLTQEFWTRAEQRDIIDQWIISLHAGVVSASHRQLIESETESVDIHSLPASRTEARSIARGIIGTFVDD